MMGPKSEGNPRRVGTKNRRKQDQEQERRGGCGALGPRKNLDGDSCPPYGLIVNENVLVVSASGIAPFLQGSFSVRNLNRCLEYILGNHSFRSRAIAEEDPS